MKLLTLLAFCLLPASILGCEGAAQPDGDRVRTAIDRGIAYLGGAAPGEPYALAFGYFLHRRFGVGAFRDAPARYDALIADVRPGVKDDTTPNAGALRLFRRLLHPDTAFVRANLPEAEGTLDLATVRALYCDQVSPPDGYGAFLREEAAAGDYRLTHAALALAWLRDHGCPWPVDAAEADRWMDGLTSIVRERPLHELGFEAAGLLAYLGEDERIPPTYVATVVAAQEKDGGWRPCPEPPCEPTTGLHDEGPASHWHSTSLALWVLLETSTEQPGDRFVPGTRPAT